MFGNSEVSKPILNTICINLLYYRTMYLKLIKWLLIPFLYVVDSFGIFQIMSRLSSNFFKFLAITAVLYKYIYPILQKNAHS